MEKTRDIQIPNITLSTIKSIAKDGAVKGSVGSLGNGCARELSNTETVSEHMIGGYVMRTMIAVAGVLIMLGVSVSFAQGQKNEAELKDGFLEKDYPASFSVADHVEFELSKKWLSIQVTRIPDGYIRLHGVGDDKGEFQMGQKGGLVQVKIVKLEASQGLHKRFQEILDATLKPAGEKAKPQTKLANDKILGRITAETSDLFDPRNSPRCTLTSISVPDVPEVFSSEIRNFINWPENYEPPKPCPYGDDDKERIMADGMFYIKVPSSIGEGGGFRNIGKFLVDKCLNPLNDIIWDGKKDGAIHTIFGRLRMFDYEFQSDEASLLVFKLTKNGYLHLEGKGTVTDLKTSQKYTFP